jgi:vacuolar iron transporter family protein
MLNEKLLNVVKSMQKNEITGYHAYQMIAKKVKDSHNKSLILNMAGEEMKHYQIWKSYTNVDIKPNHLQLFIYSISNLVFGFTFTLKIMEKLEDKANELYVSYSADLPEAKKISEEEEAHENELIAMLDEDRLKYVGSMVLGLNDALVELTGTLAGLSLALQDTKLIALSGLVTGISATLSMMSSEYLSSRSEGAEHPFKAASYTGIMYIAAVILLVLPYLLFDSEHYLWALATMIVIVLLIILVFTYYVSVAQDLPFKKRFMEMATISISVAAIAFVIGLLVKQLLGIEV